MLTASELINHLDYSAPKQPVHRQWFSWYAMIVSAILCIALLIVVMLMIPLAHAIYLDFGLEDSGITAGLWIASRWLTRNFRWAFVLMLPPAISFAAGALAREPRKESNFEAALVLSVPLACVLVAGALLITALPFVRFHNLMQSPATETNKAMTFSGYQSLFRYLAMKEFGSADPNAVAGFAAASEMKQQYPWKADNNAELLVITPVWAPSNNHGLATLRNGKGEGTFYIVLHDLKTDQVSLVGATSGNRYAYQIDDGPPTIIAHSSDAGSEHRTIKSVWDGKRFQNSMSMTSVDQRESAAR